MAKAKKQAELEQVQQEEQEPDGIPWAPVGEPVKRGLGVFEQTYAARVEGGTLVRVETQLIQPIANRILAMSSSMAFVPQQP
jgi:hypothetical protein